MRFPELLSQEIYQLNLLLWMLQLSTGEVVEPLLARAGFALRDIEVELPLGLRLKSKLLADQIDVSDPVSPDIVICGAQNEFVLIECKSTMFGSDRNKPHASSQAKQARSLLLQVPKQLASALGLGQSDVSKVSVMYLSHHDSAANQTRGLKEIRQDLKAKKYKTTSFGLLVLSIKGDAVMLARCPGSVLHGQIEKALGKKPVKVHRLADNDTDPRMLYIIPWVPNGGDDGDPYGQAVFGNRVLAAVGARVGPARPPCDIELEIETILSEATQGYYSRWKKKAVRKALADNAKRLIKTTLDKAAPSAPVETIDNPSRGWKVSVPDEDTKNAILDGLRKWQTESWNKQPEKTLFEMS